MKVGLLFAFSMDTSYNDRTDYAAPFSDRCGWALSAERRTQEGRGQQVGVLSALSIYDVPTVLVPRKSTKCDEALPGWRLRVLQ